MYNLSDKKWSELIKPNVIGIAAEINDDSMNSFHLDAEYKQSENTYAHNMFSFVHHNGVSELSLLLDCDYYCKEMVNKDYVQMTIDTLHSHSKNFISNSITELLEEAMTPEEI